MSRRDRRWLSRRNRKSWQRLTVVPVALVAFLAMGPVADAAPMQLPGNTDCKEAPLPEFPGAGVVGELDPPVAGQGKPGSVYNEQGYGGLVWHTYDLGCGPDAAVAPTAVSDTWLGNILFNAAKVIIAATNATGDALTQGGVLDKLDGLLVSGTAALYDGVFSPLVGIALAVLGATMLLHVFRGRLAVLSKSAAYAVLALGIASATYLTPILYTQLIDSYLVSAMQQVRAGILTEVGVDPKYGLGETLYVEVVWKNWLAGEFGSASSEPAKALGRDLAHSQSFTRQELSRGEITQEDVDRKKSEFESVASRVSPQTYPYLTGRAASRVGHGAFAFAEAVLYGGFQLAANVVAFVCLLTIRALILLAPVLGLVAILRNQTLVEMFRAGGAAVWQALFLVIIATVHLSAMVFIARLAPPGIGAVLLMTALTIPLWWIAGPWRRLRSMVTAAGAAANVDIPAPGPRRLPQSVDELWERIRRREGEESLPSSRRSEGLPDPIGAAPANSPRSAMTAGEEEHSMLPLAPVTTKSNEKPEIAGVSNLSQYRSQRTPTKIYVPPRKDHEEDQ